MQKNTGFISWIKKYPSKFMILLFLIVIPIFLLSAAIIINSRDNHRFYFEEVDGEPVYLYKRNLTTEKKLSEFITFDINLETIVLPREVTDNDGNIDYSEGEYLLKIKYETPENINYTFAFEFLLDTTYKGYRSFRTGTLEKNEIRTIRIPFNYSMPYKKNIFTTVERPYLFIRVKMSSRDIIEGLPVSNEEFYVKFDLTSQTPDVKITN